MLASESEDHSIKRQQDVDQSSEQSIQDVLLLLLKASLQESRYTVFKLYIKSYEEDCRQRVRKAIRESNKPNKEFLLDQVDKLYDNHIKDYAKQNRQAILDGQDPEPISRNAGIAVNALCQQMFGFLN